MKVSLLHRDGSAVLDEAGAATLGGFGEFPGARLLITASAECCGHTVGMGSGEGKGLFTANTKTAETPAPGHIKPRESPTRFQWSIRIFQGCNVHANKGEIILCPLFFFPLGFCQELFIIY